MKILKQALTVMFLMLIITTMITSCRTIKPTSTSKLTTTIKDSITSQVKTIDTLVVLRKADTLKLKATIDKLTEEAIIKKSKFAKLTIKRVGNTIQAECITDELKELIELQREIINHYKEINTQKEDTIIIPKRYIPKMIKVLAWIGGVILLLIVIGVILKFVKPF